MNSEGNGEARLDPSTTPVICWQCGNRVGVHALVISASRWWQHMEWITEWLQVRVIKVRIGQMRACTFYTLRRPRCRSPTRKTNKTSDSRPHTDDPGLLLWYHYVCACLNLLLYSQWWWQGENVSKGGKTPMGRTSNPVAPPQGKQEESTLSSSSQPTTAPQHFTALGLSLLCVWVVIMAGCPSRKVWPKFSVWGEGQGVRWWGYLSPIAHGSDPPRSLPRQCWEEAKGTV